MNYPPSPKAMEDRGIMNYEWCRACGTTNKMLDASQDIRPALHDVGGVLLRWQKRFQTRHSERSEESGIIVATNTLSTLFGEIDEWN